jgi:hypothetical protein
MYVIGRLELAEATKCTGELMVVPFVGEVTLMPAYAEEARRLTVAIHNSLVVVLIRTLHSVGESVGYGESRTRR